MPRLRGRCESTTSGPDSDPRAGCAAPIAPATRAGAIARPSGPGGRFLVRVAGANDTRTEQHEAGGDLADMLHISGEKFLRQARCDRGRDLVTDPFVERIVLEFGRRHSS